MTEHYDVIVIGSGAGGGTADPRPRPHRRSGSCSWSAATSCRARRRTGAPRPSGSTSRYRNAGNWTDAATGKQFTPKQHYYVGGNTKVYGAILFRIRERDFGEVHHVDGVSPAWPIGYADLEPWYTRAEQLYQVHGERGVDPTEPPATRPYPYPGDQPRAAHRPAVRRPGGRRPAPVPAAQRHPASTRPRPWRSACIRCATCDGFPCLINGKADAAGRLRRAGAALPERHAAHRRAASPGWRPTPSGRPVTEVVVERDGEPRSTPPTSSWWPPARSTPPRCCCGRPATRHPDGLGNGSGRSGAT